MRDDWRAAVGVPGLLLGVGLLVEWVTGHWPLAVVGVAALAAALWRLFVPMQFEIDDEGVWRGVFGWYTCLSWRSIRRHEVGPRGVLLLTDDSPSPLGYLRGVSVPFDGHRDEVFASLGRYLDRANGGKAGSRSTGAE